MSSCLHLVKVKVEHDSRALEDKTTYLQPGLFSRPINFKGKVFHWLLSNGNINIYILAPRRLQFPWRTINGQIPGANQVIERQEVALQKQVHMATAM